MFYFKLLTGSCIGLGLGWFSGYLNRLYVKPDTYLNNKSKCMAILLLKLVLYLIGLVGTSFIGIELLLSTAISMIITIITIGVWRFINDD